MEKNKILIVDDEADIRMFVAKFFEQKNYTAVEVESGLLGLNLLVSNRFDALISDISMPYMDGLEFVKRARKFAPDLVVILLTAHGSLDTAQEAIRIGVHDYFTKPASSEELYNSVEAGLKKVAEKKKHKNYFTSLAEEVRKDKERFESMEKGFMDLISHELRTPVAVISEGISLLKNNFEIFGAENYKNTSGEQRERVFEVVEKNRRRLVKVIENITVYMGLSKKNVTLNLENIDVAGLLEENFNVLSQLIFDSGAVLKKELIPGKADLARVDKERILDVISRLIMNAAYHNPKGTEITLKLYSSEERPDGRIIISVSDNGKGIEKELLENIFKPFNGSYAKYHTKGLGLGLCICAEIIKLHNGSIKIESQEGKGTDVLIEIPKICP